MFTVVLTCTVLVEIVIKSLQKSVIFKEKCCFFSSKTDLKISNCPKKSFVIICHDITENIQCCFVIH